MCVHVQFRNSNHTCIGEHVRGSRQLTTRVAVLVSMLIIGGRRWVRPQAFLFATGVRFESTRLFSSFFRHADPHVASPVCVCNQYRFQA